MLRVLRIMRLLRMLRLFRAFQRFKPLAKRLLQRTLDCVCGAAPPADADGSDAEEAQAEEAGRRKKRKSRRRSMVRILPQRRMSSVGEQPERYERLDGYGYGHVYECVQITLAHIRMCT